jgi:hypothetical protein
MHYGQEWQTAFDEHVAQGLSDVAHADDYKSAYDDFEMQEEIYTMEEIDKYPPSYVEVRVWVDEKSAQPPDEDGWWTWQTTGYDLLDGTIPCKVESAVYKDGEKENYRVICTTGKNKELKVKDVPWSAITFVEKPYTGNQFLRKAFRHEITLPEELVPDSWRDLKQDDNDSCGLYMAESAIPNSGLGMYTTKAISRDDNAFHSELVVPVEDYTVNLKLGQWYGGNFNSTGDVWLLDSYYWNACKFVLSLYKQPTLFSCCLQLSLFAQYPHWPSLKQRKFTASFQVWAC